MATKYLVISKAIDHSVLRMKSGALYTHVKVTIFGSMFIFQNFMPSTPFHRNLNLMVANPIGVTVYTFRWGCPLLYIH